MYRWTIEKYEAKEQAGKRMYEVCEQYFCDLGNRINLSLDVWYDQIRRIPYIDDHDLFPGRIIEVIGRPYYLLRMPALDCKKKSILLGSWAAGNRIPYRFIASSEKSDREIHHVFPQVKISGSWMNADPTLSYYRLGGAKRVTYAEELLR